MSVRTRRVVFLGILAIAWIATVACNGVSVVSPTAYPGPVAMAPSPSPVPSTVPTLTPKPTKTPTVAPSPTATLTPTTVVTREPTPASSPTATSVSAQGLSGMPSQSGVEFSVTVSEDEINESFSLEGFQQEGIAIQNPAITLEEGRIVGEFTLIHEPTAISVDVSLYGVVQVVDGALYFDVSDVAVSESAGFLVRIIIEPIIQRAIDQYSGEDGIPVPLPGLDRAELLDVVMSPGEITLQARTR